MAKHKILLVEDNEQNRILATFLLEEAGMEVVQALNGAEALEKARSCAPDLILLDVQLPDIDGYSVVTRLKREPALARIPVVAVTSYAMGGERQKALDLGCAGYIEKPIDTANFARQTLSFIQTGSSPMKILIVEDRPENAAILEENLTAQGYDVAQASNGLEALKKVRADKFDLVISDLLMPEMDGYQLTHAIKTDERLKELPILIYTATYTDEKDKALALSLGANGFILKPAETEAFMKLVGETIARATRGGLTPPPPPIPDEATYLKQYTERLVRKLEDKVIEAEDANKKLQEVNAALEERVAQATEHLQATIQDLNAANKHLESFAYTIAHDLRAPLRAVRGLVTILRDDHAAMLPERAQKLCDRLTHNAELMDRLIEDLLSYSQLSTAKLSFAPVDLNGAVEHALALLSKIIEDAHARVDVEKSMPTALGHEQTVVHVIANLIGNAVKFVAPGIRPEVKIAAEKKAGCVRLTVRDNGIGIAPAFQERIFEVFERLHDSEAYPGTGVGLAVVKKGVERMGGTVGVESKAGDGSCFWIELPEAKGI
jgi:CheY-like chemotaxis protein/two-component sensor histidine kinase